MDRKTFPSLGLKLIDEDQGIVEHVVTVFGVVDLGNDVSHPGSFKKTLQERAAKIRVLDSHNTFLFDPTSDYVETPDVRLDPVYDRHLFRLKLKEMEAGNEITAHVLDHLPENFTYSGLKNKIDALLTNPVFPTARQNETFEIMYWLANSNYEMYFQPDHLISA